MTAARSINVARIDDGVFTHVKVNGRLYRKENVEKAVRAYLARVSTRFMVSRPGAGRTPPGGTVASPAKTKEGDGK